MLASVSDILIIVGKTNRKALISNLNEFEIIYVDTNNNFGSKSKYTLVGKTKIPKINLQSISHSTKKRAYIVSTLNVAKKLFSKILTQNHVLLLLNDLPDEYN